MECSFADLDSCSSNFVHSSTKAWKRLGRQIGGASVNKNFCQNNEFLDTLL